MKKARIFALFILIFSFVWLKAENVFASTEASYCQNCEQGESTLTGLEDEIQSHLRTLDEPYEQIRHVQKVMKWSDSCQNFATENNQGEWGNAVYSSFVISPLRFLLDGPNDLVELCPRFHKMNAREQVTVFTVLINALTYYESGCNSKVKPHSGPNGTLSGILQLHYGKEDEYHPACNKFDSKYPRRSIRCGLEMLNKQVERSNRIFSDNSYWEVLRPSIKVGNQQRINKNYQNIRKAIRAIPICR